MEPFRGLFYTKQKLRGRTRKEAKCRDQMCNFAEVHHVCVASFRAFDVEKGYARSDALGRDAFMSCSRRVPIDRCLKTSLLASPLLIWNPQPWRAKRTMVILWLGRFVLLDPTWWFSSLDNCKGGDELVLVVPTRRRAPVVTTRIGWRRRRDAAAQVWRRCGLGEKAELRWSPHETKRSKLQSQTREEEDPSSCSNGGFARKMKKRSRQTRFPNSKHQTRFWLDRSVL